MRGIIHDWSKFLPVEWFPYVENFYGNNPEKCKDAYNLAWLHHQKINKHHWQWWVMQRDSGEIEALPIPDKYRKEMLSDWIGTGKAISGKNDTKEWYLRSRKNIVMHPETRAWVEQQLKIEENEGIN